MTEPRLYDLVEYGPRCRTTFYSKLPFVEMRKFLTTLIWDEGRVAEYVDRNGKLRIRQFFVYPHRPAVARWASLIWDADANDWRNPDERERTDVYDDASA